MHYKDILESYYKVNQDKPEESAKRLHNIVNKILKRFGGITDSDRDECYSIANLYISKYINEQLKNGIEDIDEKEFNNLMYFGISNKIKKYLSYKNAGKRCQIVVTKENGKERRNMEKKDAKRKQGNFGAAAGLLILFIIWTIVVSRFDVQAIGPEKSSVGFAKLNGFFHRLTGEHLLLYTITDWLEAVPFCVVLYFAVLGARQAIKGKSLRKVDRDILMLGGFYILVV